VSVGSDHTPGGESGYTGYEMWVRELETRAGSIVGASGCFYAIRRRIRNSELPAGLSWAFASTLVARQQGYRSVSVPEATCIVPRTGEMRVELKRKVRTMARGLSTLFYFRGLMNPFRYGLFAVMLVSHKLLRWIPYLLLPAAAVALAALSLWNAVAAFVLAIIVLLAVCGVAAVRNAAAVTFKPLAVCGFGVAAATAGFLAWMEALRGAQLVTWDPTPRTSVSVR